MAPHPSFVRPTLIEVGMLFVNLHKAAKRLGIRLQYCILGTGEEPQKVSEPEAANWMRRGGRVLVEEIGPRPTGVAPLACSSFHDLSGLLQVLSGRD